MTNTLQSRSVAVIAAQTPALPAPITIMSRLTVASDAMDWSRKDRLEQLYAIACNIEKEGVQCQPIGHYMMRPYGGPLATACRRCRSAMLLAAITAGDIAPGARLKEAELGQ